MFKKTSFLILSVLVVAAFSISGISQSVAKQGMAKLQVVPEAKLENAGDAKLIKVKEALLHRAVAGVFQLDQGKSMDLTEQKILLSFREVYNDKSKRLLISINGRSDTINLGERINFLKHNETKKYMEGYTSCFLDYTGLITPKGVPAKATFRVHCE